MACKHKRTVKIGGAKCCLDCGLVTMPNAAPFFDRSIINYNSNKERKKANAKKN